MGMGKKGNHSWADGVVWFLIKVAIALVITFGVAYVLSSRSHKYYYNRTINNVQTADFNILSSTLPAKLSIALLNGDSSEVERTVDSNYGLFGIFVTDCKSPDGDCPGQKIIYQSKRRRPELEPTFNGKTLPDSDFVVLRNPPPVLTEWQYSGPDPHAERIRTGLTNSGEVIGRAYFVRSTPPAFSNNFVREWFCSNLTRPWRFIIDVWEGRNVRAVYSLNLIVGASLAAIAILLIQKVQKNKENQRIAEMMLEDLRCQKNGIEGRVETIQRERDDFRAVLERTRDELNEARKRGENTDVLQSLEKGLVDREKEVAELTKALDEREYHLEEERDQIESLINSEAKKRIDEQFANLIASNNSLRKQNEDLLRAVENKNSDKNGERFWNRLRKWYDGVQFEDIALKWLWETKQHDSNVLFDFERQVMLLNYEPDRALWSPNTDKKTKARTIYVDKDNYRMYVVERDHRHYTVVRMGSAREPGKQRDHEALREKYPA
jgi:hypothetical protein